VRYGPFSRILSQFYKSFILSSLVSVGRDVIVRAVTGSGKTLAFAVPIIHILSNRQVFVLGEEVGKERLSLTPALTFIKGYL